MYDRQDMIDMIMILFPELTVRQVQNKVDMVLDTWQEEMDGWHDEDENGVSKADMYMEDLAYD